MKLKGFMKLYKPEEKDYQEKEMKIIKAIFNMEVNFRCDLKIKDQKYVLESDSGDKTKKMILYSPLLMYTIPYTLRLDDFGICTKKLFSGFYKKNTDIFDIYIETVKHIDNNFNQELNPNEDDILIALMMLRETEEFIMKRFGGTESVIRNYNFDPDLETYMLRKILNINITENDVVEIDYPQTENEYEEEVVFPWAYIEDALDFVADIREVPALSLKFAKVLKAKNNLSDEELSHLAKILKKLKIEEYLKIYSVVHNKKYFTIEDAVKAFIITVNAPKILLVENFLKSKGKNPSNIKEKTNPRQTNYKFSDKYVDNLKFSHKGKNPVNFDLLSKIMSLPIDKPKQVEGIFLKQLIERNKNKEIVESQFNRDAGLYNILHIIHMLSFHYAQIIIENNSSSYHTLTSGI